MPGKKDKRGYDIPAYNHIINPKVKTKRTNQNRASDTALENIWNKVAVSSIGISKATGNTCHFNKLEKKSEWWYNV